jgi:hypothetical protein
MGKGGCNSRCARKEWPAREHVLAHMAPHSQKEAGICVCFELNLMLNYYSNFEKFKVGVVSENILLPEEDAL